MSRPCSRATDCLYDDRFAENPQREAVVRIELSAVGAVWRQVVTFVPHYRTAAACMVALLCMRKIV